MDFSKCNIGLGITGSFCMFSRARKEIERLTELGANVIPIFHLMHRPVIPGLEAQKIMWKGSVISQGMREYALSAQRSQSDRIIFWISW